MDRKQFEEIVKSIMEDSLKEMGEKDAGKIEAVIDEKMETLRKDYDERVKTIIKDEITEKKKEEQKGKHSFKSFSDFAQAIARAGKSRGGDVDERLNEWVKNIKAAGDGANEAIGEDGGYLVPEEFRATLLEKAIEKSNIMQSALQIPMATNAISIPYVADHDHSSNLFGGVKFYWLDEADQYSSSKPKLGQISLRLKKVAGLCYATDEILEDSPISMEPLLTRLFSEALAWTLDGVFIDGTGVGQPLGVLNAPCKISVTRNTASHIKFEDIVNMYARHANKTNAVFYVNSDVFPDLATMSLAVGTGGSAVYMPPGGASNRPYDTLMGKPVFFTEHCETLGTSGDIIMADFSQYLVGQKNGGGVKMASSVHLKFDYDQTAFKFTFRVDGQPSWKSALTPRKSSSTVSPFVVVS